MTLVMPLPIVSLTLLMISVSAKMVILKQMADALTAGQPLITVFLAH